MDLHRLGQAILRSLWLLLLLMMIGGGMSFYLSMNQAAMYRSESMLFAMNRDKILQTGQPLDFNDLSLGRQMAQDYSAVMESRSVRAEVVRRLRITGLTEEILGSVVSVNAMKETPTLIVSATWSDPQTAALITDTTSTVIVEKINELTGSNSIGILDKASIPRGPVSSNPITRIALGVLSGLVFGLVLVYVLTLFDTTVRSAEDIEEITALPVIGIIPELSIR